MVAALCNSDASLDALCTSEDVTTPQLNTEIENGQAEETFTRMVTGSTQTLAAFDVGKKPETVSVGTQWEDISLHHHTYSTTTLLQSTLQEDYGEDKFQPTASSTPLKVLPTAATSTSKRHVDEHGDVTDVLATTSSSFDLTGDCQAGPHDRTYIPSEHGESEESSDDSDDDLLPEPEEDEKCLVFLRCLLQLFQRCQMCGCRISHTETSTRGSMISVTGTCTAGCSVTWHSQPLIRRMAVGNLLLAGAILFSGCQFAKVLEFSKTLKLHFISESSFYATLSTYAFPVVEVLYNLQQTAILAALSGESVWLMGDGQCDSPGHNAKYMTYTVMEEGSGLVLPQRLCV